MNFRTTVAANRTIESHKAGGANAAGTPLDCPTALGVSPFLRQFSLKLLRFTNPGKVRTGCFLAAPAPSLSEREHFRVRRGCRNGNPAVFVFVYRRASAVVDLDTLKSRMRSVICIEARVSSAAL